MAHYMEYYEMQSGGGVPRVFTGSTYQRGHGIGSKLDLFTLPPTQTSIERLQWIHYKPLSALADDAPVEFVVPGHAVTPPTSVTASSATAAEHKVGPVNNFLHSMFNQIDVYFNQKLVSPPNNAYAYRAYFEKVLNYTSEAKSSHLTTCLWDSDPPGLLDDGFDAPTENPVFVRRMQYFKNNRAVDLIGHLHCDVFNQDKFLINVVEMRLRLIRSKDSFCLMESTPQTRVRIVNATLIMRRAKLSARVLLAHAKMLSKTIAKYPLTRVEVKSFTIHRGVVGESLDNAILWQLPKRVIIGFVKNKAFNGDKTGIHFLNEGNAISRDAYAHGYTVFAFDLTPDLLANCVEHWNLVKHGSLRIEARFEKALETTINWLVYAEFDSVLEIDSSRQIIVDYNG
ncbi:uncharacterized protein F54H12.2-like [Pseudomyrmex gracilis]|uniref:uncharacterized protein F54H12.2-like n=1 Tax=Pseudomyrmex gracilis TaxID=219809 RepID=UPI000995899A|nr:uncharacterized protein F54H12.2-like [Pseudomyrmex gracilis]